MCFVEQKTFSVILRIFLTNAPPLWFPLYFRLQKCWRWQFLLKIVEEYENFYTDFSYYNVLCGTKIFLSYYVFSSQMRHLCVWFPLYFGYKNADVDNFYSKSWGVWLNFLYRFKGYYNVFCGRKYFLWYYVFSSQMRHLCGSLCILVYKNADVDNFYSKSLRSMSKILYRF